MKGKKCHKKGVEACNYLILRDLYCCRYKSFVTTFQLR